MPRRIESIMYESRPVSSSSIYASINILSLLSSITIRLIRMLHRGFSPANGYTLRFEYTIGMELRCNSGRILKSLPFIPPIS